MSTSFELYEQCRKTKKLIQQKRMQLQSLSENSSEFHQVLKELQHLNDEYRQKC